MSDALGPHTTLVVVQPPSLCNLNCTYCYVPNRRDATRMSVSTLERLFERVFSSPFVHDEIEILWHAGEPMAVGPDFYRQAMRTIELLNHKISWRHTLCCPASTISSYVLNGGYAYTTIISSKYHGQTLLSHLASLYPHSTPQAWQQKLNNGERTLNRVTATGSESVTLGQTLVWNRPPWMEPDGPQHLEVLFEDPHLLAVNKPSGLPTLPGGGFMENTLLRLVQKQTPNGGDSTQRRLDHWRRSKGSSSVML